MDSQPLFGERKTGNETFFWIVSVLLTLFVLVTVACAIAIGVTKQLIGNYIMAAAILFYYSILVILTRWYRTGDLDPKFKWILILFVISTVILCIAATIYTWGKPEKIDIQCDGLYRPSNGVCFPNIDSCNAYDQCLQFSSTQAYCVQKGCDMTSGISSGLSSGLSSSSGFTSSSSFASDIPYYSMTDGGGGRNPNSE